jgi:hypothetical protein
MRLALGILSAPLFVALIAWGAAALWFDGPASRPLAGLLAALFAVLSIAALLRSRPRWKGVLALAVLFGAVVLWWTRIPPSNDRDWYRDVAVLPTMDIQGDTLTVHGVRDFTYRSETDWDEHWQTRTYDLAKLRGLDLFMSYWGSPTIAHTIMSWQFEDSPPLAVSIETRKEQGEQYSAIRGFFRQYELYYVVADERDVIALRTNHRGEEVFLYRLRTPPERAKELLLSYADAINSLATTPRWYNAFSTNCTTTISTHIKHIVARDRGPAPVWDWRLYLNGRLDELLWEQGIINNSMPFPALRAASDVTHRARVAGDGPGFSARIREGLPPRPPFPAIPGGR